MDDIITNTTRDVKEVLTTDTIFIKNITGETPHSYHIHVHCHTHVHINFHAGMKK